MKISVAIPAYEMHGLGGVFISQAFASIALQSYRNVEVLVGDQANSSVVAQACASWSDRLNIRRIDTLSCRGNPSANVNAAVAAATGDLIHLLFQDDLLAGPKALAAVAREFEANPQKMWLVSAIEHTFDAIIGHRPFFPVTQKRVRFGVNTFGPPSAIAIRRSSYLGFDPQLSWMMDVEFYGRLMDAYGPPLVAGEVAVVSREWARQNTHQLGDARKDAEEVASLAPEAYRTRRLPAATIARLHARVVTSLVDEGRSRVDEGAGGSMTTAALKRIGDAAPIDYAVLSRTYHDRARLRDGEWRRAAALLISYHATEPAARDAAATLQRMETDDLHELGPFARSLASYSRQAGYATRLMPNWFGAPEPEADLMAQIKRRIAANLSLFGDQSPAREQRTQDQALSLVGACLQRACGLAANAGLASRPLMLDDRDRSSSIAARADGGIRHGVVLSLERPGGGRAAANPGLARHACAEGGYLIRLRLGGAAAVAPAGLRLPHALGAMVTVEQVFS